MSGNTPRQLQRSFGAMCRPNITARMDTKRFLKLMQVTKEEYQKVGSKALGRQLEAQLRAEGRNPYIIAVGGSTPLGGSVKKRASDGAAQ